MIVVTKAEHLLGDLHAAVQFYGECLINAERAAANVSRARSRIDGLLETIKQAIRDIGVTS